MSSPPDEQRSKLISLRVLGARWESESVTSYELTAIEGDELPLWQPGAHIDVHLPSGAIRQYSLCGSPDNRTRYRIAVLEVVGGRGGSREVRRELLPGTRINVGLPRSDFELVDASRYVFVAGGIGITPLRPMVEEACRRQRPWELIYGARSRNHFTFADELTELRGKLGSTRFVAGDSDGPLDLAQIARDSSGAVVYACGPAGMLEVLSEQMAGLGRHNDLHLERFSTAPLLRNDPLGDTFEVEVKRTGQVVVVGAHESILDAVRNAGIEHSSSCEMGICGTCETRVISGAVDHRDSLLTDDEHARGDTMMICVSRASCPRLVLDL